MIVEKAKSNAKFHNGSSKMQKKLLTEIFGIFECLITQNPTNQNSRLLPDHIEDC